MLSYRDMNTIYVSPDGNGSGMNCHTAVEGFGPCSIADAFKHVREIRGGGALFPISIKMLGGVYSVTDPISVSGNISNVTIEPYGDGEVIVLGGRVLSGFKRDRFFGEECLSLYIPEVEDGSWEFTDLYVNGSRALSTRLPSEGYFRMKETECPSENVFDHSKYFTVQKEDIPTFSAFDGIEDITVSFNHFWVDEHTPIESFDRTSGRVYMKYRSLCTVCPDQEYVLENVAKAFERPGEYYLDRKKGMLYYLPRCESEWESPEVWAPAAQSLFCINGNRSAPVKGIRVRNIKFACTRGEFPAGGGECFASGGQSVAGAPGAIELEYAENITIEGCSVECFGTHGINIKHGCSHVRVERCNVRDGGAGGIKICGGGADDPDSTYTHSITVSDCRISCLGRRYYAGCGILLMHAFRCDIIHNEISDLYYTGVSVGWVWGYSPSVCRDNRIIGNHIFDLGKGFLSDMGGVYLLGPQPGTVVSDNVIHDIKCKKYGGWALYADEGSSGILFENNLCYRTSSNCFHQHYGAGNVLRNNIFAFPGTSVLGFTRPEPHLSLTANANIFYTDSRNMVGEFYDRYPGTGIGNGTVVTFGNLMYDSCGALGYSDADGLGTLEDAQKHGMEYGSVWADPMFADPKNDDFTLSPDSPAKSIVFIPFDYRKAGPRH
ncbi:MAG: right-handed parallel beta-helix repeat-containing protein [Clostridia bacterium]|nr:right-handed parallel beta-helix repeat-containing protein [Clostridia bacterium]